MKRTLILSIILLSIACKRETQETIIILPQVFYYNAYSPLYDEYFVLKSYKPLLNKDIVWFDDNATTTEYSTPYVAMVISPYKK